MEQSNIGGAYAPGYCINYTNKYLSDKVKEDGLSSGPAGAGGILLLCPEHAQYIHSAHLLASNA
jgi:hypothetical protein